MNAIVPAINCSDEQCVRSRLRILKKLGVPWMHVDVSDGTFTSAHTWCARAPQDFFSLLADEDIACAVEAHIMVRDTLTLAESWLDAGAQKIIVHVEVLPDIEKLSKLASGFNAAIAISFLVTTPFEVIRPYLTKVKLVHILAVPPGFSGGVFNEDALVLIKKLLDEYPHVTIEVDGGIVPSVARKVFQAGAKSVVSSAYIFERGDSEQAFQLLCEAEHTSE